MIQQALDDELAQKNTAEAREQVLASITAESQRLAEVQYDKFKVAYKTHKDYLDKASRYNDFYLGDQWTQKDLLSLEETGRPALTINRILSTINTLYGEHANNRVDPQFKAGSDTSEQNAKAMSKLALHIAAQNLLDDLEDEVFEDGLIMERGFFDVRMTFENNILGDVDIETLDPRDVIPDQQMRDYDPDKWNELFISRWMSLDKIKTFYGADAARKIETVVGVEGSLGKESVRFEDSHTPDGLGGDIYETDVEGLPDEEQRKIKSIRVIERQFYDVKKVYCLIDGRTGKKRNLPADYTKEQAQKVANRYGLLLMDAFERRMYWRVTADRVVLFDDWAPYRTFTTIPFFPYFRRGKPMGVVRNLISPQEQYNKLSSQELHVVNTTANSGWIVEEGALNGMSTEELERKGSKSGVVIKVNPGRKDGVEKIKPNPIPTGLVQAKQSASDSIGEISSLSTAFMGGESAEISGVALKSKDDRGQNQIKKPRENFNRTRRLLWRKIRELVQDFYTDERVFFITDELAPEAPAEQLTINQRNPDTGEVVNDVAAGDMHLRFAMKPNRDTFNDHQFAQVINLRQAGVMIPDEYVIKYSDLYKKDELAELIAQMGQPSPEQQQFQEMQMMLALKEMDAGVQEKLANVMLLRAKAREAALNPELKEQELQIKLQEILESGDVRLKLAQIQGIQKLDSDGMKIQGKLLEKEKDKELAQLNQKQENTPNERR